MATTDQFTDYGLEVWHCQRCHKVVRLYDARNDTEALALLDAHVAFNCVSDPFLDVIVTVAY